MVNKILEKDYTQAINYIILAYAFVLPLSRALLVLFSLLLIILSVLDKERQQKFKLMMNNPVIIAFFVFILFNFISLLWTDEVLLSLLYIRKYWYFLVMIVIFTSIKNDYMSKALSAFILGMFISEIISYGVFFEFWEFKKATVHDISPVMNYIEYGVFLAFTALLLLGRVFYYREIKYKILYSLFFITVSGNLFLTAGRTGQLAFVLGLFILAFLNFKNKFKAMLVFILLTTLTISLAFNFSKVFKKRMMETSINSMKAIDNKEYCSSLGNRIASWIVSSDIVKSHPLLGIGIVDNITEFHALIDEKYHGMKCMHINYMHVHNQYFQITTQLGIVGLVLFLMMFYHIIRLPIKAQEYKNIKYVYTGIILFTGLPDVLLHRQFSMLLFAFLIGLILAQHRIENEI
jgi:O-antigen ligase